MSLQTKDTSKDKNAENVENVENVKLVKKGNDLFNKSEIVGKLVKLLDDDTKGVYNKELENLVNVSHIPFSDVMDLARTAQKAHNKKPSVTFSFIKGSNRTGVVYHPVATFHNYGDRDYGFGLGKITSLQDYVEQNGSLDEVLLELQMLGALDEQGVKESEIDIVDRTGANEK